MHHIPDPVAGLHLWTRVCVPCLVIIGYDVLEEGYRPSDAHPAIFWQMREVSTIRQPPNIYIGKFAAFVMAESKAIAAAWVILLAEELRQWNEIMLPDCSSMFLKRVTLCRSKAAQKKEQIVITCQHRLPAQKE